MPLSALTSAALLTLLGACLGLGLSFARAGGLPRPRPTAASCEAPKHEPIVLAPTEAARLCSAGRALIADARSATDFAAGHIAGAVHLPCGASDAIAAAALDHLPGHELLLVYGATTAEAQAVARSIAQRLPAAGAPQVYTLDGGFKAWETAGLACASGPCEGCTSSPAR